MPLSSVTALPYYHGMGISAMVAIALAVIQLPSSPVVGPAVAIVRCIFVFAKSGCIDKNQIQTMRKKVSCVHL